MSVCLPKNAALATSQADEIAKWTSKLINAVLEIQRDTQRDATARQAYVQNKIRDLTAEANSKKRKLLEDDQLESTRTVKANFRLIFGPPKETEYASNSAKQVHTVRLQKINSIRGLCNGYPHGVIAFSLAHASKVWTESSWEVFNGLIGAIKDEKEQAWPDEIAEIMSELEMERPMCVEFQYLRGMLHLTSIRAV